MADTLLDAAPSPDLSGALNRSGRLRGYATMMLAVGGIVLAWRIIFVPAGQSADQLPVFAIALNVVGVNWVAKQMARRPWRRARNVPDFSPRPPSGAPGTA
ncbi:hypothetical protein GCM10027610_071850 [Dactylosporangium cerinum]